MCVCGIGDNQYANTDDLGLVAMQFRLLQPSMLRFANPARGPFGDGKIILVPPVHITSSSGFNVASFKTFF